MVRAAFAAALIALLAAAARAQTAPAASTTTLALVDYVLRTDLPDLDPKLAGYFLQVDVATLPKKTRDKALARQLAIKSALKVAEGKKKGGIRWVGTASCQPQYYPLQVIMMIPLMIEVAEEDVEYAERRTNCSEDDLMCEFSLMIAKVPRPGKPPKKRYFLNLHDPLNGVLAENQASKKPGNTSFFGAGVLSCNR